MRLHAVVLCSWIAGLTGIPGPGAQARADAAARSPSPLDRFTLLGDVGYAYPVGTAETGTDTRDVSFGFVPLSLLGRYDLARDWSATARLRYAFNIPTLCASAADCEASLGRDVAAGVGMGRTLPRWRHLTAHVGVEIGWEWLTTKLSDANVASFRSWNGPFARLEVFADLESAEPWSVGPAIAVDAGMFSHFDLETPARHTGGSTSAGAHFWPTISFRVGRRL